jgi:hypothetical protein
MDDAGEVGFVDSERAGVGEGEREEAEEGGEEGVCCCWVGRRGR